jgi:hypothetical protein
VLALVLTGRLRSLVFGWVSRSPVTNSEKIFSY